MKTETTTRSSVVVSVSPFFVLTLHPCRSLLTLGPQTWIRPQGDERCDYSSTKHPLWLRVTVFWFVHGPCQGCPRPLRHVRGRPSTVGLLFRLNTLTSVRCCRGLSCVWKVSICTDDEGQTGGLEWVEREHRLRSSLSMTVSLDP